MRIIFLSVLSILFISSSAIADSGESSSEPYDPVSTAMHHISDGNEFHIVGDITLPLPCILYAPDQGWTLCSSSKFHHGESAYDGYVLDHGRVKRVVPGQGFPMEGEIHLDDAHFSVDTTGGKEVTLVSYQGKEYRTEHASTADGGIFGGGITSYYDFSITRNVFTMFLAAIFLFLLFRAVANGYRKNEGKAPKGLQSFMEPFFIFIRDQVCIPMMGDRAERFQPFIMTIFFFVLTLNLLGLVPFFPGSSNVTGNLAVTLTLALFTFIITNINGNKHYWQHVFWMPGIPALVKIILTPVEILSLFIRPFSLMIRLFANITAGHIIILSLISLIFIFGENGTNPGGVAGGLFLGLAFTAFMNLLELLVALIQAFIFAILSASYIGAATEEAQH